eukprot:480468-Amphidinium_carterae.3
MMLMKVLEKWVMEQFTMGALLPGDLSCSTMDSSASNLSSSATDSSSVGSDTEQDVSPNGEQASQLDRGKSPRPHPEQSIKTAYQGTSKLHNDLEYHMCSLWVLLLQERGSPLVFDEFEHMVDSRTCHPEWHCRFLGHVAQTETLIPSSSPEVT